MSDSLFRFLTLIPASLLASVLLASSAPRLQASLAHLSVEQAVERYWEGERPGAESIRRVIDDAVAGSGLHVGARHLEGLGFGYWLLGRDEALPAAERRRHLISAATYLRESLARSPIQPYVWLRLARVELLLDLPERRDRFGDALRMSMLTARADEHLVLDRLQLGLRYFDRLDAETRALVIDQMQVAQNLVPLDFAAMLQARGHDVKRAAQVVREENPELMLALEVALAPVD